MKKTLNLIVVLICIFSINSFSQDLQKSRYQKEPFLHRGRIIVPPKITVDVDLTDNILKIKIPYLESLYSHDTTFLFSKLSMLPINFVIDEENSQEQLNYIYTKEYQKLLNYVRDNPNKLPKKTLEELLSGDYLKGKGYKIIQGGKSLTVVPLSGSLINTISLPQINIKNHSLYTLFNNTDIKSIMKKYSIDPPMAMPLLSLEKSTALSEGFDFNFDGGTFLDYMIYSCEAIMTHHPDSIIRFNFVPNSNSHMFIIEYREKYNTLVKFSEFN